MSAPLASLLHFGAKKVPSRSTHRSSSVGDDRRVSKNCVLGLRKGAWSEEEDMLLKKCIAEYGEGNWHKVPIRSGLNRCRKSCRLRWLNYLHPNIKRGEFGSDEVDLIIRMHNLLGNRHVD
ncbi:hypothetical protein Scep_022904 [Stephania cephalantha]|uniref:Uncharacterized protein n=1 Tax=Stephania cephalantha TaxID=152367 RepID=A0AAP0F6B1_9MAGN